MRGPRERAEDEAEECAQLPHTDSRLTHCGSSLRVKGLDDDAHSPRMSGPTGDSQSSRERPTPERALSSAVPNCVVGTGAGNVT